MTLLCIDLVLLIDLLLIPSYSFLSCLSLLRLGSSLIVILFYLPFFKIGVLRIVRLDTPPRLLVFKLAIFNSSLYVFYNCRRVSRISREIL